MAERLAITEIAGTNANGKPSYPWEDWLDGSVWRLTRGEDFPCALASIREQLYRNAKARGKRVVSRVEGNDAILIQAVPRTEVTS